MNNGKHSGIYYNYITDLDQKCEKNIQKKKKR